MTSSTHEQLWKNRLITLAVLGSATAMLLFWSQPGAEALLKKGLEAQAQDPELGKQFFKKAIQTKDGDYPNAQLALCNLKATQGEWSTALADFSAIDKTTLRSDLLIDFGSEAIQSGDLTTAISIFEDIRQRNDGQCTPALRELAQLYQSTHQQEKLIDVLNAITERDPSDYVHLGALIQVLSGTFRNAECLAVIRRALAHSAPPAYETELRFQCLAQLIALGKSEQAWEEVLRLESLDAQALRLETTRIELYRLEGRLEDALDAIQRIFPQVEQDSAAYLMRGSVYFDMADYEHAVTDFERLVQLQPYDERAHYKLSETYRLLGKLDSAQSHRETTQKIRSLRRQLNSLLQTFSTAPDEETRNALAQLYQALGEEQTAQEYLLMQLTQRVTAP